VKYQKKTQRWPTLKPLFSSSPPIKGATQFSQHTNPTPVGPRWDLNFFPRKRFPHLPTITPPFSIVEVRGRISRQRLPPQRQTIKGPREPAPKPSENAAKALPSTSPNILLFVVGNSNRPPAALLPPLQHFPSTLFQRSSLPSPLPMISTKAQRQEQNPPFYFFFPTSLPPPPHITGGTG